MSDKSEKKHKKHTKKKSSLTSTKKRLSHPVYGNLQVVQEEEAQVRQQELETAARVKALEDLLKAFDDDPEGEYGKLSKGKKLRMKTPEAYADWLQSEISRLSAKESALTNKSGAVIGRVDLLKSAVMRHAMYRVDITLLGSRKHAGVRAHVYCVANDTPMYCLNGHRDAIFYELDGDGKKTDNLRVILYATDANHGVLFMSRLIEPRFMKDITVVGGDEMPKEIFDVSLRHVQPVYSNGYNSPDEDSAQYSIQFGSQLTGLSEIDASSPLIKYQSIQNKYVDNKLFVSCHLVDKALVGDLSVNDDDNNRLALTRDFHFLFDGYQRSKDNPPSFTVFANPTQKVSVDSITDVDGYERTRVDILIEFFTIECRDTMINALKEGSVNTPNPNGTLELVKTFVYVTDPAAFIRNLGWKDKSNRDRWENTQK